MPPGLDVTAPLPVPVFDAVMANVPGAVPGAVPPRKRVRNVCKVGR